MANTFIGTKLDSDAYRQFSIIAAQRGTSRSGLLKSLAGDLIAAESTTRDAPGSGAARRRKPSTRRAA